MIVGIVNRFHLYNALSFLQIRFIYSSSCCLNTKKIVKKMLNLSKAPNILIITECDDEFNLLRRLIRNLLGINSYTIYNIKLSQLKTTPLITIDNCFLMITTEMSTEKPEFLNDKFEFMEKYLGTGGKVLSIPSIHDKDNHVVENIDGNSCLVYKEKFYFESIYEKNNWVKKYYDSANIMTNQYIYSYNLNDLEHWISKIYPAIDEFNSLNNNEKDELYKCENFFEQLFFILLTKQLDLKETETQHYFTKPQPYHIFSKNKLLQSVKVIENYLESALEKDVELTIIDNDEPKLLKHFNITEYFHELKSRKLGQIVLYSDLATSTMNALKCLPNSMDNLVAIARQQTQGQGNGKNEWISPIGCAMFTLFLNLNDETFPASRLCLLQYATAISCVEAILLTPGYEKIPLKIKWPNDIYYKNNSKLGGILVKSSIMSNYLNVKIGVGLNISNSHPTLCLNDIFQEYNLDKWSYEKFISKCLTRLEHYIEVLRTSHLEKFLEAYTKYWLHSHQQVKVDYWNEEVEVIGIDSYGFLKVKRLNGEEHLLQPDGNRFDMMRNLIVFK